jgi:hypothetical protein
MWGFSLLWEDMCHTYFFKKHRDEICYADTDIPLEDPPNPSLKRQSEELKRVGNYQTYYGNGFGNQWIYRTESNIPYPKKQGKFGWDELLCIEFDTQPGTWVCSNPQYNNLKERDRSQALRRFPRPDLVLKNDSEIDFQLKIIDYKDVPLDFYVHPKLSPKSTKKYRDDIIKQLTYEFALQQKHKVLENMFFIPYYYELDSSPEPLGEFEAIEDQKLRGIKIFKANFLLVQKIYLDKNP